MLGKYFVIFLVVLPFVVDIGWNVLVGEYWK